MGIGVQLTRSPSRMLHMNFWPLNKNVYFGLRVAGASCGRSGANGELATDRSAHGPSRAKGGRALAGLRPAHPILHRVLVVLGREPLF